MSQLNRRKFLHLATVSAAGALISACQPSSPTPAPTQQPSSTVAASLTATSPAPTGAPDIVMGKARGTNPGRVVWAYNPKAALWDGKAGFWWEERSIDQALVDDMLSQSLHSLTTQAGDKESWAALFAHFNTQHNKTNTAYQPGEKIAIKINLNTSTTYATKKNINFSSPHGVIAILKQLVTQAGVRPADITVYDALRFVPDCLFERVKQIPELAGVHFAGWEAAAGREDCPRDTSFSVRWSVDTKGNPTYLPTFVTSAAYVINMAQLKGHDLAGITLCAKNHFGTIMADLKGEPTQQAPQGANIHGYVAANDYSWGEGWTWKARPMGSYNALVDLMGHQHLGEKTVLFLLDGLYVAQEQNGEISNASRWQSQPFNAGWTSSLFISQDNVAIDSVGADFLRSEPVILNTPGVMPENSSCDNYLHEAALADKPISGTVYDPHGSGKTLPSLGVHEHWNNPSQRQYSRNLGKAEGIELVQIS